MGLLLRLRSKWSVGKFVPVQEQAQISHSVDGLVAERPFGQGISSLWPKIGAFLQDDAPAGLEKGCNDLDRTVRF